MRNDFYYTTRPPAAALADVVESFWLLRNNSGAAKHLVILPDGRVDVFFSYAEGEPFHALLMGLGRAPDHPVFAPGTVIFAVSLRLPAVEYLLGTSIAGLGNAARLLPAGFWGITPADLTTLTHFQQRLENQLIPLLGRGLEARKQRLFAQLYATHGASTVRELAETAGWSSRQINRYFQARFGLSLKAYCAILRFRASLPHVKAGQLFPELNYADQAHFIKEVRKLAGVKPSELAANQHDRFIQLLTLPEE